MRTEELWVVETEDGDAYIGQLDIEGPLHQVHQVIVYNGFRGHPKTVDGSCISLLVPAEEHPDVVALAPSRRA